MDRIVTNDEIKLLLGISGSTNDAYIDVMNDLQTELLADILGIAEFGLHTVTDERVKVYREDALYLSDFPVDTSETITVDDVYHDEVTGITFRLDPKSIRTLRIEDESGDPSTISLSEVFVSYTAGYILKDTLEVLDDSALATKTLKVKALGVETTYTFIASGSPTATQILLGATEALTAAAIATKISGTVSSATVTAPLGTSFELGTATSSELAITSATLPKAFKQAVSLMVGGALADREKIGGVSSYTLGSKTVSYRSESEAQLMKQIITPYIKHQTQIHIV